MERIKLEDLSTIKNPIGNAANSDPWKESAARVILALVDKLASPAKPETPKEDPSRPFRAGDRVRIKNSPYKDVNGCEGEIIPLPKHPQKGGTYRGTINVMTFDKSMQVLTYLPDELELLNALEADTEPEFLAWRQKAWDNASRAEKAEALASLNLEQATKHYRLLSGAMMELERAEARVEIQANEIVELKAHISAIEIARRQLEAELAKFQQRA